MIDVFVKEIIVPKGKIFYLNEKKTFSRSEITY